MRYDYEGPKAVWMRLEGGGLFTIPEPQTHREGGARAVQVREGSHSGRS